MIRLLLLATVLVGFSAPAVSPIEQIEELERIDGTIHEAPNYPGRGNPLKITKKSELEAWASPTSYEEQRADYGVVLFRIKWPDATVTGAFPVRHCCTEVLLGSLTTSSREWTFFKTIRVGSTEGEVLSALAPAAKKENDQVIYCGLNECARFTIREGVVSDVSLHLYVD